MQTPLLCDIITEGLLDCGGYFVEAYIHFTGDWGLWSLCGDGG